MMSVDDALALAGQVLADYDASGAQAASGADLLWSDLLARALRDLATAASTRHVTPIGDRSAAVMVAAHGRRPDRGRSGLARRVRAWAGLAEGQVPERGLVVLSAMDADTVWQALADAGAWHGVYGDCAVCVGTGVCGERERHEVIAVQYAALRSWLERETR
jgi:hypothetical protein